MQTSPVWDPRQYQKYAEERGRPFDDLVARIRAESPTTVIDLGCGPGNLTATLLDRWPAATVHGVDSSAEMIAEANELAGSRLTFEVADLRDWIDRSPPESVDVVVSNATMQWLPDQLELLPRLVERLRPGGWLAIQIPGNADAPVHAILRELACRPPYAEHATRATVRPDMPDPAGYVEALSAVGCEVDAWETTYSHLLQGEDAVLEWIVGTGARPVLQALPDDLRAEFEIEYAARLAEAYPQRHYGTLLPFRRIFAVARKPGDGLDVKAFHRPVAKSLHVVGMDHVQVSCLPGGEHLARAFYRDALGMTEIPKPPILAARGGCWFRSGEAELHVGVEEDFRPARKAHPALTVDDLDVCAEALAAGGFPINWDDSIPGRRRFHTTDGHGNRIEVLQAVHS